MKSYNAKCLPIFSMEEFMPTVYECALMSNCVYSLDETLTVSEHDKVECIQQMAILKNRNWEYFTSTTEIGKQNGYFGAAFIHAGNKELVIAHRGTIPHANNFIADLLILQRRMPVDIVRDAVLFLERCCTPLT
jgi:hypothetical protein